LLDQVAGIDMPAHLLFIAARGNNSVYVVDLTSGEVTRTITGLNEPQSVSYVSESNRLYVSNGGDGTVDVFDAGTLSLIKRINFSSDADNLRLDSSAGLLYVGYGEGNQSGLGIINLSNDVVVGNVTLDGHPEAFELEQNGSRIYVNVPTASSIEIADKVKRVVISTWPVSGALENFPMTLDERDHRLFVGFWFPAEVIAYNTDSGRIVANLNISKDADDMFYDYNSRLIFVSCGEGFVNVLQQANLDSYQVKSVIPTAPLARTSLFVPQLEQFFVALPQNGGQSAKIDVFSLLGSTTTQSP